MSGFIIRPAVESDIPFILKGYEHINRGDPMEINKKPDIQQKQLTSEQIKRDILAEPAKAFIDVAVYDGEAIGYIFYSMMYVATYAECLWITGLYTDPFAAKPGIVSVGRKLFDHVLAKNPEISGFYAVTKHTNEAFRSMIKHYGGKVYEKFMFIGGNVTR